VALVAVLDADREGFLRSERSLIQTAGRAARNAEGRVVMYADRVTDSMRRAIGEMERRRAKQIAYNTEHGITPRTILKTREEILQATMAAGAETGGGASQARDAALASLRDLTGGPAKSPREIVEMLEAEMEAAAAGLDFELAAELRDRLEDLRAQWGLPQRRAG